MLNGICFVKGWDRSLDCLISAGWPTPRTLVESLDLEIRLFSARLARVSANFAVQGGHVVVERGSTGGGFASHRRPVKGTNRALLHRVTDKPTYDITFAEMETGARLTPTRINELVRIGKIGVTSYRHFAIETMRFPCVRSGCLAFRKPSVCVCALCDIDPRYRDRSPATFLHDLDERIRVMDRLSMGNRTDDEESTEEERTLKLDGDHVTDLFSEETRFLCEAYDEAHSRFLSEAREAEARARSDPDNLAALRVKAAKLGYTLIPAIAPGEGNPGRALDI